MIEEKVKRNLTRERYNHSMGMKEIGTKLALIYGVDTNKLAVAALLHDYAKHLPNDKIKSELLKHKVELSEEDKDCPGIWHSLLSAELLRSEFSIQDDEIYNAIRIHPTGDTDMSILEKIMVVSDYIEPNRDFKGVDNLRKLAMKDIDLTLYYVLRDKINYIKEHNGKIHPRGLRALKWIKSVLKKSGKLKEGVMLL